MDGIDVTLGMLAHRQFFILDGNRCQAFAQSEEG
jgi:hypothetical protein